MTAQKILLGIAAGVATIVLGIWAYTILPSNTNQGYRPTQPLAFSHRIHASQNKIPCQYCHSGVERSIHAGVPGLHVCMNCHSVVKTESPLIQQVRQAFEEKRPIEWVRVHELPDHVRFNHGSHVRRGVACETCHGDVKSMDKIVQSEPLTMGWCLGCHRGQTTPLKIRQTMHPGVKDPEGPVAPFQCSTCHY